MPSGANNTEQDKARELQVKLYLAAKRSPGRRFHALWDRIHRRDVLERAWLKVRENRGAAGVDRTTITQIEQRGVEAFLDELEAELREQRYRPLPVRRVEIPKPGRSERRPLGIPAIKDRVVQAAAKIVLEPLFEADFADCSFGFRPKRSAHQALDAIKREVLRGRRWVIDADIRGFFDALDREILMQLVSERVSDRRVLKLLRAWLRAGVLERQTLLHPETGTPQGGVISPLLANVYLHALDRAWQRRAGRLGVLVRYADDLVVVCYEQWQAEAALAELRALLADLGLELAEAKTRLVHLDENGEGFDFLGFHHRMVVVPCPLPLGARHTSSARSDPRDHRPATAVAAAGGDRGRPQPLPTRLGRLLPLRQLDEMLRQDRPLQLRSRRTLPRRETQAPTPIERRAGAARAATRSDPAPTRRNRRLESRALQARARHQVKDVGEPCEGKPHARFEAAAGGNRASRPHAARRQAPPADPTGRAQSLLWRAFPAWRRARFDS